MGMDLLLKTRIHYLTVSEKDKAWGIYSTGAGCFAVPPGNEYTTSQCKHSFHWKKGRILQDFALVYISSGSGYFQSESLSERKVEAGQCFMLFPNEWHSYHPTIEDGWNEYWILFNGNYPEQLLANGVLSPQRALLNPGLNPEIHTRFNQILDMIETKTIGYEQLIATETSSLIASILASDRSNGGKQSVIENSLHRAKCMLHEYHNTDVDMERVAQAINMSYSHFRRLFREYVGLTPHQYLLQIRINKAKELLEKHHLSVKQTGAAVGFNDELYFSRLFKQKTGMSPSRWKKLNHRAVTV